MRYVIVLALVLSVPVVLAKPQDSGQKPAGRKIPCKAPENVSMCYWMRGRLKFYNGTPTFRLWKVGTTRLLGIYSGPGSEERNPLDNENPEFPANLERVFEVETRRNEEKNQPSPFLIGPVFGSFEVCPLDVDVPGRMQPVCIESVKDMFVEMSKRGYR